MYECFDFLVLAIGSLFAVSHYFLYMAYENKSALAYDTLNPAL